MVLSACISTFSSDTFSGNEVLEPPEQYESVYPSLAYICTHLWPNITSYRYTLDVTGWASKPFALQFVVTVTHGHPS